MSLLVPSRKIEAQPAAPRRSRAQSDTADRHSVGDGRVPAGVLDERRDRAERQGHRDTAIEFGIAAEAIGCGDGHEGPTVRAGRIGHDGRRNSRLDRTVSRSAASSARAPDARLAIRQRREESLSSREITVLADKTLPYSVLKKVMSTCTAASYGKLSLAVIEKELPAQVASATA